MSNLSQTRFAFVAMDDLGRPKSNDRSFVRSHVMRGKNQRENSRRSIRKNQKARKLAAAETAQQLAPKPTTTHHSPVVTVAKVTRDKWFQKAFKTEYHQVSLLYLSPPNVTVEGPTGAAKNHKELLSSSKSHVRAASSSSKLTMGPVYTYENVLSSIYPIDKFIDFQPFDADAHYAEWLVIDDAAWHLVQLTIITVREFALNIPPSKLSMALLRRTTELLNERLNETAAPMVNSTIYIILTLAFLAGMFDDQHAISIHMAGLRQVIRLRGDIERLRLNPKLHFKVERVDLTASLCTGRAPSFSTKPESWDPILEELPRDAVEVHDSAFLELQAQNLIEDERLMAVVKDFRSLTCSINEASRSKQPLDGDVFQNSVSSIQARLLHLQDSLGNTLGEGLRLGMLALLTTMFRVPSQKVPFKNFERRLRNVCHAIEPSTWVMREVLLWFLMVGSMTVLDVEESWVREKWRVVADSSFSWDDIRRRLRGTMWIDCINEDLGRRTFLQLIDVHEITYFGAV